MGSRHAAIAALAALCLCAGRLAPRAWATNDFYIGWFITDGTEKPIQDWGRKGIILQRQISVRRRPNVPMWISGISNGLAKWCAGHNLYVNGSNDLTHNDQNKDVRPMDVSNHIDPNPDGTLVTFTLKINHNPTVGGVKGKVWFVTKTRLDLVRPGLAEEDEEDPGAFVGLNKEDKPNKDNMCRVFIGLPRSVSDGTVKLERDNDNIRVWTDDGAKGVLENSNATSWDLTDAGQRSAFRSAQSNLWVEGVKTGEVFLTVSHSASENARDKIKFTVVDLDFVDCEEVADTDMLPLFNPSPVVKLDALADPGAGENPSVKVTGTIRSFVAPIEDKRKVLVNGTAVANLSTGGLADPDGKNGLGPFVRKFESADIALGNGAAGITVVAVNSLGNLGSDGVDIAVQRDADGKLTGRTVTPRASVPATDPDLPGHSFRIALSAAITNKLDVTIETGLDTQTTTLTNDAGRLVSRELFLVPRNLKLPAGASADVKETRLKAAFGKKVKAHCRLPKASGSCMDEGVVRGVLFVRNAKPIDHIKSGASQEVSAPSGHLSVTIEVGARGAGGDTRQITLTSQDARQAALASPGTGYPPVKQTVQVTRCSADPKDEAYNHYKSDAGIPILAVRGPYPIDASSNVVNSAVLAEQFVRYDGFLKAADGALENVEPVAGFNVVNSEGKTTNTLWTFEPWPIVLIQSPKDGDVAGQVEIEGEVISFLNPVASVTLGEPPTDRPQDGFESALKNPVAVNTTQNPANGAGGPFRASFKKNYAIGNANKTVVVEANGGYSYEAKNTPYKGRDAIRFTFAAGKHTAKNLPTLPSYLADMVDQGKVTDDELDAYLKPYRMFVAVNDRLVGTAIPANTGAELKKEGVVLGTVRIDPRTGMRRSHGILYCTPVVPAGSPACVSVRSADKKIRGNDLTVEYGAMGTEQLEAKQDEITVTEADNVSQPRDVVLLNEEFAYGAKYEPAPAPAGTYRWEEHREPQAALFGHAAIKGTNGTQQVKVEGKIATPAGRRHDCRLRVWFKPDDRPVACTHAHKLTVGNVTWNLMFYVAGDNNLQNAPGYANMHTLLTNNPALAFSDPANKHSAAVSALVDLNAAGPDTRLYDISAGAAQQTAMRWWDRNGNGAYQATDDDVYLDVNNSGNFEAAFDVLLARGGAAGAAPGEGTGYSGARADPVELNMTKPETLRAFVEYCRRRYPARYNMLIFKNHGHLSKGHSQDKHLPAPGNRKMSYTDTRAALDFPDRPRLDVVMFDQCLMSSIHVMTEMRKVARYMIGSEVVTFAGEVPYKKIVDKIRGVQVGAAADKPLAVAEQMPDWIRTDGNLGTEWAGTVLYKPGGKDINAVIEASEKLAVALLKDAHLYLGDRSAGMQGLRNIRFQAKPKTGAGIRETNEKSISGENFGIDLGNYARAVRRLTGAGGADMKGSTLFAAAKELDELIHDAGADRIVRKVVMKAPGYDSYRGISTFYPDVHMWAPYYGPDQCGPAFFTNQYSGWMCFYIPDMKYDAAHFHYLAAGNAPHWDDAIKLDLRPLQLHTGIATAPARGAANQSTVLSGATTYRLTFREKLASATVNAASVRLCRMLFFGQDGETFVDKDGDGFVDAGENFNPGTNHAAVATVAGATFDPANANGDAAGYRMLDTVPAADLNIRGGGAGGESNILVSAQAGKTINLRHDSVYAIWVDAGTSGVTELAQNAAQNGGPLADVHAKGNRLDGDSDGWAGEQITNPSVDDDCDGNPDNADYGTPAAPAAGERDALCIAFSTARIKANVTGLAPPRPKQGETVTVSFTTRNWLDTADHDVPAPFAPVMCCLPNGATVPLPFAVAPDGNRHTWTATATIPDTTPTGHAKIILENRFAQDNLTTTKVIRIEPK